MNKKLCTALHLVYHTIFGSTMYVAGSGYLEELKKIRNEINTQSTKITVVIDTANAQINKAELACKKLTRIRL